MTTRKHVLILPYPAFGHVNPLLDLARKIAQVHDVTFAVSEIKLVLLRRQGTLNPQIENQINFVGLEDGLTEEDEKITTKVEHFLLLGEKSAEATRNLLETFAENSQHGPGDVFVVDDVAAQTVLILVEKGLPYILFHTYAASPLLKNLDIDENTPVGPDDVMFLPPDREKGITVPEAWIKVAKKHNQIWVNARSVIFNTFEELEDCALTQLKNHPKLYGKIFRLVAPLFSLCHEDLVRDGNQLTDIKDWLDQQPDRSVVYFSFGSLAISSPAQVTQIANALLHLNKPFIWSLKTREQQSLPAEILEKLPSQFSATSKFLVLDWAPQKLILKHQATKVFVSHCGWNSTLETLVSGIPAVAWPMFGDQFENAPLLEKLGTGLTIPGTCMMVTRLVSADEISKVIQTVAGWDESRVESRFWLKAQEVQRNLAKAVAPGGCAFNGLHDLIHLDIPA